MFCAIMVLPRPFHPRKQKTACRGPRVRSDENEIARFGEQVQRQRPLDDIALDARGPGPVEVGHQLEPADLGGAQTAFEAAVRAFGDFDLRQLFEQLARRPALLGGVGQHVVHLRGHGAQADPFQMFAQTMIRVLRPVEWASSS
jgi:hypothetical protein